MKLPGRYIERVSDADVTPILYRLTHAGNVLINKLKQYGVNYSIPFSGEYIVDGKIFFNTPYPNDLYENIHNDYYLIRHRLEIVTEGKLGDSIWAMSDIDVSNKDLQIHEDILNDFVKIGDDTEKNQRWMALGENKNAIIFYGLDFTLFRKLYWEIGVQNNDQEIIDFTIDLYKSDWSVIKGRYSIPNVAGVEFWKTPQFITFIIAAALIVSAPYLIGYFTPAPVVETGAVSGTMVGEEFVAGTSSELMLGGSGFLGESAVMTPTGLTLLTPATIPMVSATAGVGWLTTIGETLTTAVSVAGTASKYLGGGQKQPQPQSQQQPFDIAGILGSMSNQNTQMLLLTLGGFIFFTLISD